MDDDLQCRDDNQTYDDEAGALFTPPTDRTGCSAWLHRHCHPCNNLIVRALVVGVKEIRTRGGRALASFNPLPPRHDAAGCIANPGAICGRTG
jgi:hypothetical protein